MSSPPQSRHRRHPSDLDFSSSETPIRPSSSYSYSPVTPRSRHSFTGNTSLAHEFAESNGGLGSLADELADAWDEDDEGLEEGTSELPLDGFKNGQMNGFMNRYHVGGTRDSGIDVASSSPVPVKAATMSPAKHKRKPSRYDGSEYGEESDLEAADGVSPGLEARMAAVEALARRGLEENGSGMDGVVFRVTEALRELGSQGGIEGGATRLATAHTSLATHLTHQTRSLASTTSTLLSPFAAPLPPDDIDPLLPLLTATLSALPRPSSASLHALHSLDNTTRELAQMLSYLADSLQIARQTSLVAERRLRGCKEVLAEWRREEEGREEGFRWIEEGKWEQRLRGRGAGRVCAEVCRGFEEVCEGWRVRLFGGMEGVGVGAG